MTTFTVLAAAHATVQSAAHATVMDAGFDPKDVNAGWAGFVIIALMAVALYFILRSFVKQLKKVDFEEQPPGEPKRKPPPAK